jgi:RNA polymerase-binding transcription factor DksA
MADNNHAARGEDSAYGWRMKATLTAIPRKWSWHYGELMLRRDALLRERDEHNAASRETPDRGGVDEIDAANDESEYETLAAEISQEQVELAEIDAALARIRDGSYGVCEASGEQISPERLRALPWTRFSKSAAEQREPPPPAQ